jgi:membrane-associated phospholipid phosphatase
MHPLHVVGALAASATAALAAATRLRRVQGLDDALERFAGTHRELSTPLARIGTLPGERWVHPLLGGLSALAITLLGTRDALWRAVLPLAGASLGAIVAHHAVKLVYRRPRPAIALSWGKTEPAFPSGHTADASAVLLTSAWLMVREGLLPPGIAWSVAIVVSVVTGASRVALGWHWGTDVLGGWLTGIAVAAGCALLYEGMR